MTPEEFLYIKRAVVALEDSMTLMERIKVQRTMAQILDRSAIKMEEQFVEEVDHRMAVNHLVDILKR
jgi:hypothetical protein